MESSVNDVLRVLYTMCPFGQMWLMQMQALNKVGLLAMVFASLCYSQIDSLDSSRVDLPTRPVVGIRNVALLVGYNGFENHFAEIGIAVNDFGMYGHHPTGKAAYLSSEIALDGSGYGLKLGRWYSGMGITVAGNIVGYWTNGKYNAGVRPEFGFGLGDFKIVYGINLLLPDFDHPDINTHLLNATFAFGLWKIRDITSWD